jgi:hypothetical protein
LFRALREGGKCRLRRSRNERELIASPIYRITALIVDIRRGGKELEAVRQRPVLLVLVFISFIVERRDALTTLKNARTRLRTCRRRSETSVSS